MTQTTAPARFWTRKASAVLAAALVASSLAACDVDQMSVEQYLTRAEDFRKKGDLNASIIEAKNALQVDSGKQDARFILGLNYLDLGAWTAAETMLDRVVKERGVLEYAAIPPLARAKIALGKYDQVLELAHLQEDMRGALKADVLVVRGQALNATGKAAEARSSFEEALQSDPASFAAYIGLATIAVAENDAMKARDMLAKASEIAPDAVDVLLFRGHLEYRDRNLEASRDAFRKLVGIRPERPEFHLGKARAEIGLGEFQQAIKSLEYPLKVGATHPPTNYFRALVAYRTRDYQNALNYAEIVLNLTPGDARAQLIAGAAAFALGRYEIALDKLKKVLERAPDVKLARELLGLSQLKLGQPQAGYATLAALADADDSGSATLELIGQAALLTRDMKAGIDYLEKAVALDPDNARARALLATAMVDRGELDKGISELRAAVAGDRNIPRAEIVLVVSLIKAQRYDEALKAAQEFQRKYPRTGLGYTLEGGIHIGLKDEEKARAAFEKAFAVEPGRPDAGTNLALLAMRRSEADKASEYLRKILDHHPAHGRTLNQLWRLEDQRGRSAELEPLLEKAVQADGGSVIARTLLGRLMLASDRPQKALGVVLPGLRAAPTDTNLLQLAGKAHFELNEHAAAVSMLRRFLEQRPQSVEAYFLLALSYQGDGQPDAAATALEKVVELDERHANARFLLTRLHIRSGRFDAAAGQIATLKTQFRESSAIAFLEAELLQGQEKFAEAAEVYANMPGERSAQITRRLAQAQWRSGDRQAALATLQGWLEKHPDERIIKLFLGSYLTSMKRTDEATALFRQLIESSPDSWVVQNEIAWTLFKAGDAEQALPYARRARELAPQNPAVADTTGMILLQIGNVPQALVLLREAAEKMPDDLNVRLHLAQALVKSGLADEARQVLADLLAARKDFSGRQEAAAMLKKLEDGT